MFTARNSHETHPFQHDSKPFSTASSSQGTAFNTEVDFSQDSSPRNSSAALFDDFSTLDELQFPSYSQTGELPVPRTSESGSLNLPSLASAPDRSLLESILRLDSEGDLDVNTAPPDLMPSNSEPWMLGAVTPKSASRLSHHRESSLSSLGSAGPASPYTQTTSNPHIQVVDSTNDGYHDLQSHDSYYQLAKGTDSLQPAYYHGYDLGKSTDSQLAPRPTAAVPTLKPDRGLLVAPEFAIGSGASHPSVSVASSAASDSPATSSIEMPGDDRRRRPAFNGVPKLDRSMTDAYTDELYNPNYMGTSSPTNRVDPSPTHGVFAQRITAANHQHLNAGHSPVSAQPRERSPFRNSSPLAPMSGHDFHGSGLSRFRSAQQMREQGKMEQDARAFRHQVSQPPRTDTPKTISPKDAVLEFQEPEGGSNFPLFPQQELPFDIGMSQSPMAFNTPVTSASLGQNAHAFSFMPNSGTPSIMTQYPFAPQQQRTSDASHSSGLVTRVGPSDRVSRDVTNGGLLQKAPEASNDGGTYTCTYHGCTLRFETPALLQKHKREGHRQAHGVNSNRKPEAGASPLLNSQAGPHKCDRINPSTGKPCNTIFSRPYDLTRHEDTIHNNKKMKVRCSICTEEKTFSRADALTRHFRVCHPEIEVPGKHRRRAVVTK